MEGRILPFRHLRVRKSLQAFVTAQVGTIFYFLATAQILLGLYLIAQGVPWLGYARRRMFIDPASTPLEQPFFARARAWNLAWSATRKPNTKRIPAE